MRWIFFYAIMKNLYNEKNQCPRLTFFAAIVRCSLPVDECPICSGTFGILCSTFVVHLY